MDFFRPTHPLNLENSRFFFLNLSLISLCKIKFLISVVKIKIRFKKTFIFTFDWFVSNNFRLFWGGNLERYKWNGFLIGPWITVNYK